MSSNTCVESLHSVHHGGGEYLLTMSLMAYGWARERAASFSEAGRPASCLAMMPSNTFCLRLQSMLQESASFACRLQGMFYFLNAHTK